MPTPTFDILLVEDNPGDVRLIEYALGGDGSPVRLMVAEDGVEALRILRREGEYAASPRPRLVLLDLNLPRMDGRELLDQVKRDGGLHTIPVVVLSSSEAPEDVRRCYELGANAYVPKLADLDGYLAALRALERFWFNVALLPAA